MREYLSATAEISEDEKYRYQLDRTWKGSTGRICTFVMFNPSTADGAQDDPTIRRCARFARWRYRCDALRVVNLFAYRATRPIELSWVPDPVGPNNDDYLRAAISTAKHNDWPLVVAWGALADTLELSAGRVSWLRQELAYQRMTANHLGVTKAGHPRHPLYVRQDVEIGTWT